MAYVIPNLEDAPHSQLISLHIKFSIYAVQFNHYLARKKLKIDMKILQSTCCLRMSHVLSKIMYKED